MSKNKVKQVDIQDFLEYVCHSRFFYGENGIYTDAGVDDLLERVNPETATHTEYGLVYEVMLNHENPACFVQGMADETADIGKRMAELGWDIKSDREEVSEFGDVSYWISPKEDAPSIKEFRKDIYNELKDRTLKICKEQLSKKHGLSDSKAKKLFKGLSDKEQLKLIGDATLNDKVPVRPVSLAL